MIHLILEHLPILEEATESQKPSRAFTTSWGQGDNSSRWGPLAEAALVKTQTLDWDPDQLRWGWGYKETGSHKH